MYFKSFHAYISSPHTVSLTVCVLISNNNYHPISQDITPSFTTLASIRDLKLSTNKDAFKTQSLKIYLFIAVLQSEM